MEAPPQDPVPLPGTQPRQLKDLPDCGEPPAGLKAQNAEKWRKYWRAAQELLALPAGARSQALRPSDPEHVPAGVLVLCIRQLTGEGRVDEATAVQAHLLGAAGSLNKLRYHYLGALRSAALKRAPAGQGHHDGEDLFQAAVLRIMNELHTNSSAVTSWVSFCLGRLGDAQRDQVGRKGEKLRAERAEGYLPAPSAGAEQESIFDREFDDPPIAGSMAVDVEAPVHDILRDICAGSAEPERSVLQALWFDPACPTVNAVAKQVGLPPDRVRNIRLDAGKQALEAVQRQGHPRLGAEALANVWASLPARRGAKPKRRGKS